MPQAARVQAIRTLRRAATQLISSAGPTAIRALPRIATSVRRTSITRHTPPSVRPRVVAGTAQRLVRRQPRLRRQLTRPLIAGRRVLQRATAAVRAGRPPSRALRIGRAMGGSYGSPTSWGGGYAPGGYGQGGYASSSRRIVIRGPVTISIRPR
jgi:hypothetical protein